MVKRIITVLTAIVFVISFASCGAGSSTGQTVETSGSKEQSSVTVSELSSGEEDAATEAASEKAADSGSEAANTEAASIVIDEETAGLLEDLNPAAEPASCDGFEDLSWGNTLEDLPEAESTEVVFRGVEFAGYFGSAHYIFNAEDRLIMGSYLLNELMSLDWSEALKIYLHIRNYLISEYGLPSEVQRGEGPSTIEELINEGGGAWGETWSDLASSSGDRIILNAMLQGNGMIEIQFINMTARQE